MGTGIETQRYTIVSRLQHEGRQIEYYAKECLKIHNFPPIFEIIRRDLISISSGEEDDEPLQLIGKIPDGAIRILPPTTPYQIGFIGSKPYNEVIIDFVAKKPVSDKTKRMFQLFLKCFQGKFT